MGLEPVFWFFCPCEFNLGKKFCSPIIPLDFSILTRYSGIEEKRDWPRSTDPG